MKVNYKMFLMRDREFFQKLGKRVATLRQDAGLSQAELAVELGLKQQALATYETATRRIPCSLMIPICEVFDVTLDELFGVEATAKKPGPVPKLQQNFEAISKLSKSEQKFFNQVVERFLNDPEAA